MNIFYLDRDPKIAAQLACDKHVVKMILESAQMLCTAHRVLDGDEPADHGGMYKMVHKNHPSTIWTRTSEMNYQWHWRYFDSLLKEYTHRYGKHHATERLRWILRISPSILIKMHHLLIHLSVCLKLVRVVIPCQRIKLTIY